MTLPRFLPVKHWLPATAPGRGHGSVYPPIEKLADGRLIVDRCGVEIAVFDNRDHPNAALLPPGTPRAVVRLYRRDWQLRFLRAVEAGPILAEIEAALAAWTRFTSQRAAA